MIAIALFLICCSFGGSGTKKSVFANYPIHVAVKNDDLQEVKRIIYDGALSVKDLKGETALSLALYLNNGTLDYLIEKSNSDEKALALSILLARLDKEQNKYISEKDLEKLSKRREHFASFVSLLYEKSGRDVGFCNILFSMISFRNKKLVINSVDEELKKVFVANSDSWELVYGMVEEEKPGFLQIVQNHDKVLETYITEIENKIDILVKSVKRKALKKRLNKFRSSNPHIAVKILDMVSFTLDLIFNYKGLIDVKSDRYFKDGSDSASVALRIITVLSIFVKELSEFKIDRAINKDEIRYLNEKYSELSSEILNREVPGRATKAIKKG